jgi:nitrogen-specific signal transduction histidine kinase
MRKSQKKPANEASLKPPETVAVLAGMIADDFNNILTTVMGACSLIDKNNPANSELLQYVDLIRSSAERAADLSDRLVHASIQGKNNGHSGGNEHEPGSKVTHGNDNSAIDGKVSRSKHSH